MGEQEIKNFILLVATMRAKQKAYFRGRMGRDLEAAKKTEREVDKFLEEYKQRQMDELQLKLF